LHHISIGDSYMMQFWCNCIL